jgi:prepilin-type N-terminal cleavage/methylation domain-containing protein
MDFKITSTKKRRSGFTLVEMLVGVGIAGIGVMALSALSSYTARSFAAMLNYADLDNASRNALDLMSQQIRQTNHLTDGDATHLVFEDYDGKTLTYQYSAVARTLTRSQTGEPDKLLLRNCDELVFSLFQRNPMSGSYDVYPTATPATCKLVQLRWTCSRDLLRARVNTESVQSSKIVIRKQ